MNCNLCPIGEIREENGELLIEVFEKYRKAMTGLEEHRYLQIIWWFDRCDNEQSRNKLTEEKPYKKGPALLGTFATRSPERPNPIAVSNVLALSVEAGSGTIRVPYIDAFPGTPVLDIKPYTPSIDRVENVTMPEWCEEWPRSVEASGDFDWSAVFNFGEA